MVRAIVWKEWREQGLIALTLLVLGSGILVAAAVLADPPSPTAGAGDVIRYLGAGRLGTLLLAVTAGMVCGGALFAAEREAGTMGFLESLPASRWGLWRAKLAAGLVVVVGEVAVILGVSAALGLVPSPAWAAEVAVYALQAFAWGAYGSTLTRTTLGSVGVAIPSAVVAGVAFLLPIMLFLHTPGGNLPRAEGGLLFLALMFAAPLGVSVAVFTRPDRDRSADEAGQPTWAARAAEPAAGHPEYADPGRPRLGWKALVWLSGRQLLTPGAVISGLALAAGLLLLAPTVYPFLAWPPLALAAGVLAGVTVFADEQAGRSAAFWGERRLPVGRVWAVKVAVHALFAAWLLALIALPSVVRAAAEVGPTRGQGFAAAVFRSHLVAYMHGQVWKYLLVPAVYGFAAGHLCGMLFRKTVVAAGVAGLTGGTVATLWLPSLLGGGLHHWQVWLPPAAALLTARLLARAWAADRLPARGPLGVLATGVAAVLLVEAGGVAYRVVELPDEPGAEDDVRFVASLPEVGRAESGRSFRTAADRLSKLAAAIAKEHGLAPRPAAPAEALAAAAASSGVGPMPGRGSSATGDAQAAAAAVLGWAAVVRPAAWYPGGPTLTFGGGMAFSPLGTRPATVIERVEQVPSRGWVPDPDLASWLDKLYGPRKDTAEGGVNSPDDKSWLELMATATDATDIPAGQVGIYEHPQLIQPGQTGVTLDQARRLAVVVLARGLQRQAAGDPTEFVRSLRVTTALSASLRNQSIVSALHTGYAVDRATADAVLHWLTAMDDDPGPVAAFVRVAALRRAAEVLHAADREKPFDPRSHLLVERHVLREAQKAPAQWLTDRATPPAAGKEVPNPEADLVGFAWTVPWERERTRRLLGLGFEGGPWPPEYALVTDRPGAELLLARRQGGSELVADDHLNRAVRRGALMRVAVRLYREQTGRRPATADDLVTAGCLPAVPEDPFDGRPFRYRPYYWTPVSALFELGAPAAWSVGPNGTDDGGRPRAWAPRSATPPDDIVFEVPFRRRP